MPPSPLCFGRPIQPEDQCREEVKNFHCGDAPWSALVAEHLQNGDALRDHQARGEPNTLLYFEDETEERLIGYLSFAPRNVDFPIYKGGVSYPGFLIGHVAVATKFQNSGYFSKILKDLAEAAILQGRTAILLFVDERNEAAQDAYSRRGFAYLQKDVPYEEDGVRYKRMVLKL